jgi:hypothetical protein
MMVASTVSNGVATATATLNAGTVAGGQASVNVLYAVNPTTNSTSATTGPYTVTAGPLAFINLQAYFVNNGPNIPPADPTSYVVPKGTLWLNVFGVDKFGNPYSFTAGAGGIQVNLQATCSTCLSATTVYIFNGKSDTWTSGYAVQFTAPNSVGVVTTITASLNYNGQPFSNSTKITTVSPLPNTFVKSPSMINNTIVTRSNPVTLLVVANATKGIDADTISALKYSLNKGPNVTVALNTGQPNVAIPVSISFPQGLNTLTLYVADSQNPANQNKTTVKVLADYTPPTIAFVTPDKSQIQAGQTVQATITDNLGILNFTSVTVTYNSTALPASAITITGTNSFGTQKTYSVSISGLPSGKWKVTISAKDLAGNAATPVSITVIVVVPTNQSFTLVGQPVQTTFGGFPAIQVTYQNNLPAAQQGVVFAVVHNAKGQTVMISTSTINPSAGAQSTAYLVLAGLGSGTYTVDIFVTTPSGVSISLTTTITVTV